MKAYWGTEGAAIGIHIAGTKGRRLTTLRAGHFLDYRRTAAAIQERVTAVLRSIHNISPFDINWTIAPEFYV
jgi:hypothetical protein